MAARSSLSWTPPVPVQAPANAFVSIAINRSGTVVAAVGARRAVPGPPAACGVPAGIQGTQPFTPTSTDLGGPAVALNSGGGVAEMHVDTGGDLTCDVGQIDGGSIDGISNGADLASGSSPAIALDDKSRVVAAYVASNLWTAKPGYANLRGGTVDWGDPSSGTSDVFLVDVAVSAGSGLAVAILALGSQGAGSQLGVATLVGSL